MAHIVQLIVIVRQTRILLVPQIFVVKGTGTYTSVGRHSEINQYIFTSVGCHSEINQYILVQIVTTTMTVTYRGNYSEGIRVLQELS